MKRKWFASLLAICMLILLIPASAFAADGDVATVTHTDGTVTTTNSYPTVEAAINAAQDGDTVTISAGTYTPQAGASEITIDKAITIQGEGNRESVLNDYVFNIQSTNNDGQKSNPTSVTFDNLSFTGTSQIKEQGVTSSSNAPVSLTVNNCYAKLEYTTKGNEGND